MGSAGGRRIAARQAITARKADAVDQEAGAFADVGEQDSGDGGPDHARGIEDGGVERDGVDQVFLRGHLNDERLAAGHVEGVDDAERSGQREHVPDLNAAGEGEGGEGEGL